MCIANSNTLQNTVVIRHEIDMDLRVDLTIFVLLTFGEAVMWINSSVKHIHDIHSIIIHKITLMTITLEP